MKIKYFKDKYRPLSAKTIWLVDLDSKNENWFDMYIGYMPIGRHCPMHEEFTHSGERVIEITREDYMLASDGIYTPEEYLQAEVRPKKEGEKI